MLWPSVSPSSSSIAMKSRPSSVIPKVSMRTMAGCASARSTSPSRRTRAMASWFSDISARRSLSAMGALVAMSTAR
jgi:hypothetical protein